MLPEIRPSRLHQSLMQRRKQICKKKVVVLFCFSEISPGLMRRGLYARAVQNYQLDGPSWAGCREENSRDIGLVIPKLSPSYKFRATRIN